MASSTRRRCNDCALTGSNVKLGKWAHYLAMREGVLAINARYRELLSNDLGAVAGLLFDVGMERYPARRGRAIRQQSRLGNRT